MKSSITIILTALVTVLFQNCGAEQSVKSVPSFTQISGTIEGGAGKKLFLNRISDKGRGVIFDTILIKEDDTFDHQVNSALKLDYYVINSTNKKQFYLITDSTESISIKGKYNSIDKLDEVSGSIHTSIYREMFEKVNAHNEQLNEFNTQMNSVSAIEEKKKIFAEKKTLSESFRKEIRGYIEKNSNSAGIAAFFDAMDFTKEPKVSSEVINHLAKTVPYTNYYKARETYVKTLSASSAPNKTAGAGKVAPNIELEDPDGVKRPLYDLRGKVVLIDFWASWCGPCRRENPNVIKAYNKYKDQGFDVYSVSLDSNKERWVQAIEEDGLIWNSHVSDLKKWATPYKKTYGFSSIPHTVLVDKDGTIIQTKIRGSQLEHKLEEIFGF